MKIEERREAYYTGVPRLDKTTDYWAVLFNSTKSIYVHRCFSLCQPSVTTAIKLSVRASNKFCPKKWYSYCHMQSQFFSFPLYYNLLINKMLNWLLYHFVSQKKNIFVFNMSLESNFILFIESRDYEIILLRTFTHTIHTIFWYKYCKIYKNVLFMKYLYMDFLWS